VPGHPGNKKSKTDGRLDAAQLWIAVAEDDQALEMYELSTRVATSL
jgi:hypothetical protein